MSVMETILNDIKKGNLLAKLRFRGMIKFSIRIKTITGLLIAGGTEEIEIGKIDKVFIRDPITNLPYIPGSSLKGVMRSMLEYKYGKVSEGGKVHVCDSVDCPICRVFGTTKDILSGPTRVHVADGIMTNKTKTMLEERGLWSYTELKTENFINRIFGRAESPRTFERVPPQSEFASEIHYLVFATEIKLAKPEAEVDKATIDELNKKLRWEEDIEFIKYVIEGLILAEDHGLGASTSRGYGKVEILIDGIEVHNLAYYNEGKDPVVIPLTEIVGKETARPRELLEKFEDLKRKLIEVLS